MCCVDQRADRTNVLRCQRGRSWENKQTKQRPQLASRGLNLGSGRIESGLGLARVRGVGSTARRHGRRSRRLCGVMRGARIAWCRNTNPRVVGRSSQQAGAERHRSAPLPPLRRRLCRCSRHGGGRRLAASPGARWRRHRLHAQQSRHYRDQARGDIVSAIIVGAFGQGRRARPGRSARAWARAPRWNPTPVRVGARAGGVRVTSPKRHRAVGGAGHVSKEHEPGRAQDIGGEVRERAGPQEQGRQSSAEGRRSQVCVLFEEGVGSRTFGSRQDMGGLKWRPRRIRTP